MSESFAIPEPFEWDASFDIKIGSLNEQHKNLFRLIDALAKDQGNGEILKELLGAVKAHFDAEETLFTEHGYTHAEAHKAVHDKFLADCAGVAAINDDVIAFLKNWLVVHIKGSDMKYAEPLSAAGAN